MLMLPLSDWATTGALKTALNKIAISSDKAAARILKVFIRNLLTNWTGINLANRWRSVWSAKGL
jgi:hypothetical protein